jgi:hypothetical protein
MSQRRPQNVVRNSSQKTVRLSAPGQGSIKARKEIHLFSPLKVVILLRNSLIHYFKDQRVWKATRYLTIHASRATSDVHLSKVETGPKHHLSIAGKRKFCFASGPTISKRKGNAEYSKPVVFRHNSRYFSKYSRYCHRIHTQYFRLIF